MSAPEGAAADADYHPVARQLHWFNAILAVVTIALAWCIIGAPRHGEARGWAIMLHGSCGIAVLGLIAFWSGWRLRHPSPPLRPLVGRFQVTLARATHVALLLLFVAMPLSGYASLAAAGHSVSLFGLVAIPPLVPQSGRLSQAAIALHLVGQFAIYGLVALHAGAAAWHGFIRRDGVLDRMLPRRSA
jgi:cytochrome b561